jgi:hypothetical protein
MQHHEWTGEYYELEYSDWDGLVTKYGGWENDGRFRRESSDALTWSTLSAGTFASAPFTSSNWSKGSTLMPIVVTDASTLYPHVWRWERSIATFTDWGAPYVGKQFGQVGTSQSSGYVYAFFMRGQTQFDTRKQPRYSYHTSTSTSTVMYSTYYASRHGVTGAHDPKSGKLIHVWRDWDNTILLSQSVIEALPGAPTTPTALTGASRKAVYTPSVSCGASAVTYNCILAWASAAAVGSGQHHHTLHWAQFYVSGSSYVFGSVYSNGYLMYGPPAVVYKGPDTSSSAFVVAFKNPGNCYYTLRKSTTTSNAFNSERSHCSGSGKHNGPPMLGSTTGDWAEAWAHFNTED